MYFSLHGLSDIATVNKEGTFLQRVNEGKIFWASSKVQVNNGKAGFSLVISSVMISPINFSTNGPSPLLYIVYEYFFDIVGNGYNFKHCVTACGLQTTCSRGNAVVWCSMHWQMLMQVMWKDLHLLLVYNRHLQTSSLMTYWIAETKFYKTTMEELVK